MNRHEVRIAVNHGNNFGEFCIRPIGLDDRRTHEQICAAFMNAAIEQFGQQELHPDFEVKVTVTHMEATAKTKPTAFSRMNGTDLKSHWEQQGSKNKGNRLHLDIEAQQPVFA